MKIQPATDDIEVIPDKDDDELMRLQLVILETLVIRRDIAADQTQGRYSKPDYWLRMASRLNLGPLLLELKFSVRKLVKSEAFGVTSKLFDGFW